ncbi:MAG TPA: metallophosphoesterase [Solirubrobacteraceae bacterium]|jgi:3',5'-cyclic AMP phosphodiesterase CpdA|nr:metallophosphoesterase [Solirubrobacteraceae bacterium]
MSSPGGRGRLLAIGDLHITYPENRRVVEGLRPSSPEDWLIVCGDVSELSADLEWALGVLRERFSTVIWVPGNHDLWTVPEDPVALRGVARYLHLVEVCRRLGVLTPEDPYPVWEGPGGPAAVVPLFLLYDYSFGSAIAPTKALALARAHAAGVVCSDELVLFPDPFPSREAWCEARVRDAELRLCALDPQLPTVLVNHFPLVRAPTAVLRHPEFAQWCGTALTADWHVRFRARAVVYGHLHIPRTTVYDGVPFFEVSLGYPREWHRRRVARAPLRPILPLEGAS